MLSDLLNPPLDESETRPKLIDPRIGARDWIEEYSRREELRSAIEIIAGKPRRRNSVPTNERRIVRPPAAVDRKLLSRKVK